MVEPAIAQRPARMITNIRHRAELSIPERDRERDGSSLAAL
jgi:hypothetical protein